MQTIKTQNKELIVIEVPEDAYDVGIARTKGKLSQPAINGY